VRETSREAANSRLNGRYGRYMSPLLSTYTHRHARCARACESRAFLAFLAREGLRSARNVETFFSRSRPDKSREFKK